MSLFPRIKSLMENAEKIETKTVIDKVIETVNTEPKLKEFLESTVDGAIQRNINSAAVLRGFAIAGVLAGFTFFMLTRIFK